MEAARRSVRLRARLNVSAGGHPQRLGQWNAGRLAGDAVSASRWWRAQGLRVFRAWSSSAPEDVRPSASHGRAPLRIVAAPTLQCRSRLQPNRRLLTHRHRRRRAPSHRNKSPVDRIPAIRPAPFLHPDADASLPAPKRVRYEPAPSAKAAVGALQGLVRPPALPPFKMDSSGGKTSSLSTDDGREKRLHELQVLREKTAFDGRSVPSPTLPLAGYLLARRLDGRPVDSDGVRRLRNADAAITEARATMALGRGNVNVDLRETGGKSRVHMVAARGMVNDWDREGARLADAEPVNFHVKRAAASMVFGAGSCAEHASLAVLAYGNEARFHAQPLQERVQAVHHRGKKHGWAEVRPGAGSSGRVVMDAWADGPAVFAEDSRFAKDRKSVSTKTAISVAEAAEGHRLAVQASEAAMNDRADEIEERCQKASDYVKREWANGHEAEWKQMEWSPQPVLDGALANRTRQRLHSLQSEVHAAGVAMSLGSWRVRDVVNDVPRIIDAAKTLLSAPPPGDGNV